ncbi:hypothetical protein HELRODRAFT_172067 [Helobdella robusta]|uniref:cyclin-dependent kinase n=1 Tax=Helobdella robusta TaxID=6412 RepID=T1F4Z9_HELRO|nr:hypothetical protein HELRODRAFT_172067 [Helobdella robusta]ESO05052.1 hypothetical protein HELRODRAFT_172067 [Helobdella robusta]
MENYRKIEKIGEGTYGKVYKAKDRRNGQLVAIKKILIEKDDGIPCTAVREVALLKELKHASIVELLDVIITDTNIYLAFEYLDFDLNKYMKKYENGLPPRLIQSFMKQLLKGLVHCHVRKIVHRDLKPQNILVDKEGNVKIADFGLSRSFEAQLETYTHEVVTLWYRCPEILLGCKVYGFGVDIWSLACIFVEMFQKKTLFRGDSEIGQLFQIFHALGTPNTESNPNLLKLPYFNVTFPKWPKKPLSDIIPGLPTEAYVMLEKMLQYEPSQRITCEDALREQYFQTT